MTIYNQHNARGATAYDVDAVEKLKAVMSIDTDTGEVICAHQPFRLSHLREVDTFTLRFRSIHPILGGYPLPCLFHCYGRQPA